ncbi:MAG: MCE family protein [Candidatus Eremiobacteraeota bacterium]|nr:MCE family protein [Candidatus Eremiobacteraeota bacterium]
MSRQAQVGAFAILALILVFGLFYVITDFGTRHTGYRMGIHFDSAAGLQQGSVVYFSGVSVGTVEDIQLLDDNTVDVIVAINRNVDIPRNSQFLIQAPLTGSPNLVIVPPRPQPLRPGEAPPALASLPRQVLPIADQPRGRNSATIADLLDQGQGEIRRLDTMLADLETKEPHMLNSLQQTLDNANHMSIAASNTVDRVSASSEQLVATLQSSLNEASGNIVALTGNLNGTVSRNSRNIDSILSSLNRTSVALNESMNSLRDLAANKQLKTNIVDTTQNIADLTKTLQELAVDLRQVTGSPQTQAQMRDTVANIDAAAQKANSLLGTLGGRSQVYGVDEGVTPYPPVPPGSLQSPAPGETPARTGGTTGQHAPLPKQQHGSTQSVKAGLGSLVGDLYAVQLRVSGLSAQHPGGSSNPLLSGDRGPQTDVNLLLLPRGGTSFVAGANDIGARTTWNFAAVQNFGHGVHAGGGVLYSRLGLIGTYDYRAFGIEARGYDLRRPTFDLYGNFNLTKWAKVFLGQRDTTHNDRRTVYGLQLQF